MKTFLEQSKSLALLIVEKAKVRRGLLLGVATLFVFQLYFVRELLAAELLFGLGFAVLLALVAVAFHYSLTSLLQTISYDTPLAYVALVPVFAGVLAWLHRVPAANAAFAIAQRTLDESE